MRKKIREALYIIVFLVIYSIIISILGIGCPIKFMTGISCAGCGMTRAFISVLHLHFAQAFSYHPLFWTVPIWGVIILFRDQISVQWCNRIVFCLSSVFIIVYVARLMNPQDTIVEINITKGAIWRLIQHMREALQWLTTIVV